MCGNYGNPDLGPGESVMDLNVLIDVAASWLADHHRERFDVVSNVPKHLMREMRYLRARRMLEDAASSDARFGGYAPCMDIDSEYTCVAAVTIFPVVGRPGQWCVFGYLPTDMSHPSFIHPPEVGEEFRRAWENEGVTVKCINNFQ